MHDDDARRPPARGLLIFVGPAAVVGHGAAAEGVQRGLLEISIIDEDDEDLASDVDVLEIVPLTLWCRVSVAHKNQISLGEHDMCARRPGRYDDVLAGDERPGPVTDLKACRRAGGRETVERDRLGPATVLAARLEPGPCKLVRQIGDDLVLGGRGDPAALEVIG